MSPISIKVGFVTCVELGLSCMRAIYDIGGVLDLAVSLKDRIAPNKSGRIYIDDFCHHKSIPLLKIEHVNDPAAVDAFRELDWLFIVGWSQIAGPQVIDAPRRAVLGMHPTLLPEGRGRAAIPWAILKNLRRTGVTLFKLDEGVDTGPIVAQRSIELEPRTTATELYRLVNRAHVTLVKDVYPRLLTDAVEFVAQDDAAATVWPGRKPDDGAIDLDGSVYDAERLIRAVTRPYPGAFYYHAGSKVIVWAGDVSHDEPPGAYLRFKDGYIVLNEVEVVGREDA